MTDQAVDLDERFRAAVAACVPGPGRPADRPIVSGSAVTGTACLELFEAQATSRQLDLAARRLGSDRRGYYSIGSSGHEGNAALAAALRSTDPALLHYRSGAFFVHRARQVPGLDPIRDVLLGVVAAATDPISGGRHKVFGSAAANVIPQTSTIASHLPRAVGLAFAIDRAARLGVPGRWPADAVVLCSFGDASANHSTAAGAINAAIHTAGRGIPMPILFVCEDNGIGISVPTPPGWIEQAFGHRPGLAFFSADGCAALDALTTADAAAQWVRQHRAPAFLRLRTVRLLGHAGSDVETAYRRPAEIAADLARDPVAATARLLIECGVATPAGLLDRYADLGRRVAETAELVCAEPKLTSAAAVIAPIAPSRPALVRADALRTDPLPREPAHSGHPIPRIGAPHRVNGAVAQSDPMTLAQAVNDTLAHLLERDRDVLVFGEDVGRKGGVYGVTKGLQKTFGARRVFDTLLDEQSVLGTALGAALAGFLPIPEIQYLAYLHNAADQIRGEAATLSFFSDGRYRNPMVVRIAGYAYQKGFGGHFHNDNSVAALRDIPGVVLASPSRADDAAAMLRTCVSAARVDGRVCLYLEPIALYHTRDLHRPGDDGWLARPSPAEHAEIGRARVYGEGADLTLVSFANGVPMSLRAARRLARHGIHARVLDLRWLAPLPADDLLRHARATGRVLVADETRRGGGVSEAVCAALLDAGFTGRIARVTSEDSFVPLGPAAATVLLDEDRIEAAALRLLGAATGADPRRAEARPSR
ncbi:transketolase C-terminal domain-containing protein [Nocardia asiatica]|uniref:transketolase C-terminal domain-containing protein n=1 Tax=Nocardia asiatica TaxID=209252 RepID=UPI00245822AB|nr:transketolase C-terminal domain-containing protein [Nocardia asiatica]